jgi:hypothetical protein
LRERAPKKRVSPGHGCTGALWAGDAWQPALLHPLSAAHLCVAACEENSSLVGKPLDACLSS